MLTKRIIEGLLLAGLVLVIIFFFPNWVFCLVVMTFIGFGLHEFFDLVGRKGIFVYRYFGIIAGILVPVIIYFQMGTQGYVSLDPFYIILACLLTFVLQFVRRDNSREHLISIAVTMLGLLYVSWFFSFFVKLKFMPDGEKFVFFLILVTKCNDVGAFFLGKAFGKHNLIPRISPKKTVEGTIGGFILCVLASLISKSYLHNFSYGHLLILGVLLGILGQVGDLAESLLKRDCDAKDSRANFSGLGGVLDIIDSLLFTTPIFYFYLVVVIR